MRSTALALSLLLVGAPGLASAQGTQGVQFDQAMRASAALQLAAHRAVAGPALPSLVSDDWFDQRRHHKRKKKVHGVPLMLVGGSAVAVGAMFGDTGGTILIFGGFAAAGYGFYRFTK